MDAIRAIAMILGVVLHSIIVYQAFPRPGWPVDLGFNSIGLDLLYKWIHSFRMPLFYLIAGFFAHLLYLKVGEKKFIRKRALRIYIPFVLGVLLLTPPSAFPFLFFQFMQEGFSNDQAASMALKKIIGWNGFYHLWFLYYLIMFYLSMIGLIRLQQVLGISSLLAKMKGKMTREILIVSSILIIFSISFLFFGLHIEPWTGIKVKPGQYLFYGFFFLVGFILYGRQDLLSISKRYTFVLLLIGTSITFFLPLEAIHEVSPEKKLLLKFLISVQTILLVYGSLSFFINFYQKENKVFRYISDASYWYYLIHFPFVVNFQILFLNSSIPGFARPVLVFLLTTLISFASYHYLVRYTVIGKFLHGVRVPSTQKWWLRKKLSSERIL